MISSLLCLSVLVSNAFAAPKAADGTAGGLSVNLQRRVRRDRTTEELGEWARTQREALHTKYGRSMPQRRSTGTNLIVNQNTDSSFYGSLAIGTPAVSYNVILDTGSADLWVADSNCASGCSSIPTFDTTSSSTYTNSSDAFKITYGSGAASGSLGKDTIQMAGFSVPDQVFGVCDVISSGLVSDPVSGLLGLAWESIAASGAMPFWQTLVAGGAWDEPLMAFQLTRFIGVSGAQSLEPGGTFTMGSLNTSLYTGDIDYIDLVNSGSYWMIPLTSLTVQGSSVTVGSGSNAYAAIDTGTTLVGGPADEIAAIYALIPDAVAGTGNYEGYYLYPCDTAVNVTVSFGGQDWTISSDDFQSNQVSRDQCMGSFFEFEGGNSGPTWIFGDTFLKNVYSVFRYDSPAVGFAQLSDVALAMNGDVRAAVPAATIGSIAAQVSATSVVDRTNGALSGSSISSALTFVAALSTVFILLS